MGGGLHFANERNRENGQTKHYCCDLAPELLVMVVPGKKNGGEWIGRGSGRPKNFFQWGGEGTWFDTGETSPGSWEKKKLWEIGEMILNTRKDGRFGKHWGRKRPAKKKF